MQTLLVQTNCPTEAIANSIALKMVEARLAACVNILPRIQSIYHWQGKVESTTEVPLLFKTTAANYPALEAAIKALHPYSIPEIIALPIEHCLPAYASWIVAETAP